MPSERLPLTPLPEDEWPTPLIVAIVVAILLAIGVFVGGLLVPGHHKGASVPGALFLTVVLLAVAGAMYRRRYWAVLGFQALVGFQILAASLALLLASTVRAAVVCVLAIGLGGWMFWKLVRVMGRIQAADRQRFQARPPGGPETQDRGPRQPVR